MKKLQPFLIALIAAAAVTAVIGLGALQRMDKWTQDAMYQRPGVTSGDIVIIGIDEDAIDLLGPYNTWDRNVIASALEALAADPEKKPAVVSCLLSGYGGISLIRYYSDLAASRQTSAKLRQVSRPAISPVPCCGCF